MLDVNIFKEITKVINNYKKDNFNYIDLLNDLNKKNIEIKRYKIEKYFFFLKKWNFVENTNGKKPFVLKDEIPVSMVKYLCTFTDLNETEREELKNKHFRNIKLNNIRLKVKWIK
ncbi:MAG: hypothetical protein ACOC3V_02575 [bacterium]